MSIELGFIDYCRLAVYFAFVLGIGFVVRKGVGGTTDSFGSGGRCQPGSARSASLGRTSGRRRATSA